MGIYDKGDLKIKIECTPQQFAYIKARFILAKSDEPCIFNALDAVKNCYGVNCRECFNAHVERVLSADEQELIDRR